MLCLARSRQDLARREPAPNNGYTLYVVRPHGFSAREQARLEDCLGRLIPSVRIADLAVTGGIAIQLAMVDTGWLMRSEIADLDMVASTVDAISPGVTDQ